MPGELETRVMRKISFRIVPFIMLLYFIAFIDRVNIGFAALTMNKDLGFSPAVFGLGAGIFFLGYFIFEVPSNLILNKVGARLWIARVMITWGIVSAAFAFISGETTFLILRFLLGVAEAGFFPGIILYLSFWFPARYRAGVVSLFMAAAPISVVLGSPLSSALLEMDGLLGLRGWQWMFIMEAIPAFLLGFVVLRYLTRNERRTCGESCYRQPQHLARTGRPARPGAFADILRNLGRPLYTRHLGAADHQGIRPVDTAGWVSQRCPADRRRYRNGSLGSPFRQDQRTHLARRCSLHRRSRGPCARRIRRVLGVGCCRTHAGQYRHQLSKTAALGDANHVPVGICGRRWHRDDQLDRQPRWLCRARDHRLDQGCDRQLPGRPVLCIRLARPIGCSHAGSLALATHGASVGSTPLRSLKRPVFPEKVSSTPSAEGEHIPKTVHQTQGATNAYSSDCRHGRRWNRT